MIRIEYSNGVEERHLKYFSENIICNFDAKININNASFLRTHKKFFDFCKDKARVIAIGKPHELEAIHNHIKTNFIEIIENIEKENKAKKAPENGYKTSLLKIFGYSHFCESNIFDCLNEQAESHNDKNNWTSIRKKIVDTLLSVFPENKNELIKLNNCKSKTSFKKELMNYKFVNFTQNNIGKAKAFEGCWNAYIFALMSEINVCPYCNRQFISPIYSEEGKVRGDIDHFLPKSLYPYFSMSLYNLIPVCKSCNQSLKRDNKFDFDDINPFVENLDSHFIFKADLTTDRITLKPHSKNDNRITKYIDIFKLQPLYNYHQNQVKELKIKRIIYPDSYISELFSNYKKIFAEREHVVQLIVGVTNIKDDLKKEAFHKFKRDIATQLNFFNDQDEAQILELRKILETSKTDT